MSLIILRIAHTSQFRMNIDEKEKQKERERKRLYVLTLWCKKRRRLCLFFMHAKSFVDNLIITPFQNATSRLGFYIISKFYLQLVLSISKEFDICKISGYTDFKWIVQFILSIFGKKLNGHFHDIFNHVTCILWCQEENLS